jgi:hypothetical protein
VGAPGDADRREVHSASRGGFRATIFAGRPSRCAGPEGDPERPGAKVNQVLSESVHVIGFLVHDGAVVTISITPAAFAAIASTLPKGYTAVGRPNGQGGYLVTLDPHALDRIKALRRPGQTYSDVILRLAKGDRTRDPLDSPAQ